MRIQIDKPQKQVSLAERNVQAEANPPKREFVTDYSIQHSSEVTGNFQRSFRDVLSVNYDDASLRHTAMFAWDYATDFKYPVKVLFEKYGQDGSCLA
jgi:hypothetical protein